MYISQESSLISSPSVGGEETWSLLLKLNLGRINCMWVKGPGREQPGAVWLQPGGYSRAGKEIKPGISPSPWLLLHLSPCKRQSRTRCEDWRHYFLEGDIISWKETLAFHHRCQLLHVPEPFFRILISWWLLCTCLDPLRSLRIAISWASALGSRISYSAWVLASPLSWVLKEAAILAFSFLRRWLQDFSLGETWGWVPNKQIFLTAFLHDHPRLWTGCHRNTGQCRSEETSGCHPIQPLPQTIIKYSKFLRTMWRWALNICKNWDSTTSLGNLFQCWISLTVNIFVLVSRQNFLCCNLWRLPLSFCCASLWKAWHCPTFGSWWQELGISAGVLHWHTSVLSIVIQRCLIFPAHCDLLASTASCCWSPEAAL